MSENNKFQSFLAEIANFGHSLWRKTKKRNIVDNRRQKLRAIRSKNVLF